LAPTALPASLPTSIKEKKRKRRGLWGQGWADEGMKYWRNLGVKNYTWLINKEEKRQREDLGGGGVAYPLRLVPQLPDLPYRWELRLNQRRNQQTFAGRLVDTYLHPSLPLAAKGRMERKSGKGRGLALWRPARNIELVTSPQTRSDVEWTLQEEGPKP